MSLFIGEDVSTKKILHITNGTQDLAVMKSGVNSNTIFHNDMQFSSYAVVPITSFEYAYSSGGTVPSPVQYLDGVYRTANYFLIFHCDTSKIALHNIGADSSFYLLNSLNQVVATPYNFGFTNPAARGSFNGYPSYPKANTYITADRTLPCLGVYAYRGYTPTISSQGIAKVLIIYKPSNQSIGSGVHISNTEIQIGNINLSNFQYVYSGSVNTHPECLQITPYLQLVDTSKIIGGLSIVSNPGFTVISKGGHNIIATDDNYYDTTGGTSIDVATSAVYSASYRYFNIVPLSGNLMYIIITYNGSQLFKGYINNYTNFSTLIYAGPDPYNKKVILATNGSYLYFRASLSSPHTHTVYTTFAVYYKVL